MHSSRFIETVGSLIKIDDVTTIQHNTVPNTLVLEIIEPYPAYHGDIPSGVKPNQIFLVLAEEFSVEECIRAANRINKYVGYPLDATPAKLTIYNDTYYSIRIRGLRSFEQIPSLQNNFMSEGLKFMKKKNIKAPALIHLRKSYILEEVKEGIYRDLIEPMMWYFKFPDKLEWNMLQMMTRNIKNNIENTNFDAAFGWIFVSGVTDFVRIYVNEPNIKQISYMQQLYLDEYKKYLKLT